MTCSDRDGDADLLRFTTAGSVDDGKSTLIGRLLHDAKAIYEDQLAALARSPPAAGRDDDRLLARSPTASRPSASRASPSTWPTATSPRPSGKFIIADTPGPRAVHAQHGHRRLDRQPGRDPDRRAQRRAARSPSATASSPRCWASRTSWSAVNKMDLVDYAQDVFERDHATSTATSPPSSASAT